MQAIHRNPCEGLKQLDFFGQPVELTFKNKKKFTSVCGRVMSVLCLFLLTAMLAARTHKLSSGDDPFFSMTEVSKSDLQVDLWQRGFFFAVQQIDPAAGELVVAIETMGKDVELESTPIELVDCYELKPGGKYEDQLNNQAFDIDRIYSAISGAEFLCPVGLDSMLLEGVFDSERFTYLKVAYEGCKLEEPELNCMPDDQIAFQTVNFITLNTQPNILGQSKDETIEFVQEMKHFNFLDPSHTQLTNLFYLESNMLVRQNWWDFLELAEYSQQLFEFSYAQPLSRYIPPALPVADRSYVEFYLRADQKHRQYKREEYDILSYFSDIGGLLDIIILFGYAVTWVFVSRSLQAALVQNTYRLQQYNQDTTQYYQTQEPGRETPEQSDRETVKEEEKSEREDQFENKEVQDFISKTKSGKTLKSSRSIKTNATNHLFRHKSARNPVLHETLNQKQDQHSSVSRAKSHPPVTTQNHLKIQLKQTPEMKKEFKQRLNEQRNKLIDREPKKQQFQYIYHLILNQRRIIYGQCNAILYYFRCFHCRKDRSLKRRKSTLTDFQLNKGIDKLKADLDVVNILEMIKGYRIIKQVLFSKDDQVLLKLQSRDTINSQDDDEQSDSRSDFNDNPHQKKLNQMKQTYKLLSNMIDGDANKDDRVKQDVRQMLQRYEDQYLEDKEFRLLQGVLSNDFGLLEHIQVQEEQRRIEKERLQSDGDLPDRHSSNTSRSQKRRRKTKRAATDNDLIRDMTKANTAKMRQRMQRQESQSDHSRNIPRPGIWLDRCPDRKSSLSSPANSIERAVKDLGLNVRGGRKTQPQLKDTRSYTKTETLQTDIGEQYLETRRSLGGQMEDEPLKKRIPINKVQHLGDI